MRARRLRSGENFQRERTNRTAFAANYCRNLRIVGDINPLLYRIAQGAPRPAFRDVTLGGNAVDNAGPGYDLVTGLGTPDIDNLVRNLQIAQRVGA